MDCLPHYTTTGEVGGAAHRQEPNNSGTTAPSSATSTPDRGSAEPRLRPLASPLPSLNVTIGAWGYAQADLDEFESLRKRLPSWVPEDTPNHFFRYADEQTILGAWAIDDALRRSGMRAKDLRDWGIIAAPEFLGRPQLAGFIDRFQRNGGPRVSPNSIVQHSLHSVSGALSILLSSRGPNVGVGGGRNAFSEGLLAALTLFDSPRGAAGCWLVATTWSPLPLPDAEGNCTGPARCHAAVLALHGAGSQRMAGALALREAVAATPGTAAPGAESASVLRLIRAFQRFDVRSGGEQLSWSLPWGATLDLELRRPAMSLRRAA